MYACLIVTAFVINPFPIFLSESSDSCYLVGEIVRTTFLHIYEVQQFTRMSQRRFMQSFAMPQQRFITPLSGRTNINHSRASIWTDEHSFYNKRLRQRKSWHREGVSMTDVTGLTHELACKPNIIPRRTLEPERGSPFLCVLTSQTYSVRYYSAHYHKYCAIEYWPYASLLKECQANSAVSTTSIVFASKTAWKLILVLHSSNLF